VIANVFGWIKKMVARFFILIGVFTFSFILIGIAAIIFKEKSDEIKPGTMLKINFDGGIVENSTEDEIVAEIFGAQHTMFDVIRAIDSAAKDQRIKGIVAKISNPGLSYAQIQELRESLLNFKKTGKIMIAYSDSFGEVADGTKAYYLASAFTKIYLQSAGTLGFAGIASESYFLKGLFEKLGVEPIGGKRKEYKSYWNMFTEDKYTEFHKESVLRVIESISSQIYRDVAVDRKKTQEEIKALVDLAPFFPEDALKAGLIDGIKYRDEVFDEIEKMGKPDYLTLSNYITTMKEENLLKLSGDKTVALIIAEGEIHRGRSDFDPTGSSNTIGADTMAKAIRDAVNDKDVKALLIRVDSPGGSVVASETIWREVAKAKDKKKPLVISMSSVAASGGYYISMPADRIFAEGATMTGSIGVIVGKFYTLELWKKLGITFDSVATNKNTMIFSSSTKLDEAQTAYLNKSLDNVYDTFVKRASESRKQPFEKLEESAKGRVWTGEDALARGLVDELGGYNKAIASVRKLINAKPEETINFKKFPEEENFLNIIMGRDLDESSSRIHYGAFSDFIKIIKPLSFVFSIINPEVLESKAVKAEDINH